MTPAQHDLIVAACARAAECWTAGDEERAIHWFGAALNMVGSSGAFVDEEVDR